MRPAVWKPAAPAGGTFGGVNQPTAGARSEKALPKGEHPYQLYSLGSLSPQPSPPAPDEVACSFRFGGVAPGDPKRKAR